MHSYIGRGATVTRLLQHLLQEGQQAIQKMLVLMAYKCLSMSCTLSEVSNGWQEAG